jgi:hypothetical protein
LKLNVDTWNPFFDKETCMALLHSLQS